MAEQTAKRAQRPSKMLGGEGVGGSTEPRRICDCGNTRDLSVHPRRDFSSKGSFIEEPSCYVCRCPFFAPPQLFML